MYKLPKIRRRKSGSFFIKFRVGKELQEHFGKEFITKSFSGKTLCEAQLERIAILREYSNIVSLQKGITLFKLFQIPLIML